MKEIYIDIMERAFLAYDKERISAYIDDVKKNGLKEHGFPRFSFVSGKPHKKTGAAFFGHVRLFRKKLFCYSVF